MSLLPLSKGGARINKNWKFLEVTLNESNPRSDICFMFRPQWRNCDGNARIFVSHLNFSLYVMLQMEPRLTIKSINQSISQSINQSIIIKAKWIILYKHQNTVISDVMFSTCPPKHCLFIFQQGSTCVMSSQGISHTGDTRKYRNNSKLPTLCVCVCVW